MTSSVIWRSFGKLAIRLEYGFCDDMERPHLMLSARYLLTCAGGGEMKQISMKCRGVPTGFNAMYAYLGSVSLLSQVKAGSPQSGGLRT